MEGMVTKDGSGKSINDMGKVKIKTCTKKVRCNIVAGSGCPLK